MAVGTPRSSFHSSNAGISHPISLTKYWPTFLPFVIEFATICLLNRQGLPRLLLRAITVPQRSPCVSLCLPIQDLAVAVAIGSWEGSQP